MGGWGSRDINGTVLVYVSHASSLLYARWLLSLVSSSASSLTDSTLCLTNCGGWLVGWYVVVVFYRMEFVGPSSLFTDTSNKRNLKWSDSLAGLKEGGLGHTARQTRRRAPRPFLCCAPSLSLPFPPPSSRGGRVHAFTTHGPPRTKSRIRLLVRPRNTLHFLSRSLALRHKRQSFPFYPILYIL